MADDGLKRIKLSEDYAGQKAGSIYVCDPLRAQWLLDNDHGREATAADLKPKPARREGYQATGRRVTSRRVRRSRSRGAER